MNELYDAIPATDRVTRAIYTAEEVAQRFQALHDTLDYTAELADLGIGALQWKRRKKIQHEFKALSVALWGLALQKSFPQEAAAFFAHFCETTPIFSEKTKEGKMLRTRVNIYVDLLSSKKDTDFMPVAVYFADILALRKEDARSLSLRLSLIVRALYSLIFSGLV